MTNTNPTNTTLEFLIHRNEVLSKEVRGLHAAMRLLEEKIQDLGADLNDFDTRIDYLDDQVSELLDGGPDRDW